MPKSLCPKPLSIVSDLKADLVVMFNPYLIKGFSTASPITKPLIEEIINKKSFGASFTYEMIRGMKRGCISKSISSLANGIYKYLSSGIPFSTQVDYDNWEEMVGKNFLADCLSEYGVKFEFGKAQKIINVTMKHLYCYDISEKYFEFCHVALDSMTYVGRSSNSRSGGFYRNEVNIGAKTKSFSNLTYKEYIDIQIDIRDYLSKGKHDYIDNITGKILTPFKAEFYIWPRYKK